MNHNWYAVLPAQVLLSKELTDKQKLLIALISNLSNERGYCFASNKYLGECLDCSESTIKDHLKRLEDMKILGRIIKVKENGDFDYRSLIITIDIPKPENKTTLAKKLATPSARKLAHNNIVINNKVIIPINISFDDWWSLYDKKVGNKSKLEQKWYKLTDEERSLAISHTKEYIKAQPEKQYRKNPDTYLNNEAYYDEIIKPKVFYDQVPTNRITTQIKLK